MSLPLPASFYLASCECPRFDRWDSKIFTDILSLSAFLTKEIKDIWADEDQTYPDYVAVLQAASPEELKKAGSAVVIDFSEIRLKVTVHSQHTFLTKVLDKLPKIGHELH
jgi:hypothetical protein